MAFDALFAPLGRLNEDIPPALWLIVARSAGLLAVALAFRLPARLAGGGRSGVFAGVVAAGGLALTPLWVRYLGHGSEAPMALAFGLWGIERHLNGVRHQALSLGVLACLLRPEVFPFVALYALYLWHLEPERQLLIAGLLVALPVLWIVPEWIGSGLPLSGEQQATSEPSWSLSHAAIPWLAALNRAHHQVGLPLEVGALAGLVIGALRRDRTVVVMGVVVLAWAGMFAVMTQVGFSGNARYFLPALPLISILAGVGAARLVTLGARTEPLAGAAVAACVVASLVPFTLARVGHARAEGRRVANVARLQNDLQMAVEQVGGPEAVVPHGAPTVNRAFETRLAWELKLSLHDVEVGEDKGLVFRTDDRLGTPKRLSPRVAPREVLARVGKWRVFASPPALTVFSHSAQQ